MMKKRNQNYGKQCRKLDSGLWFISSTYTPEEFVRFSNGLDEHPHSKGFYIFSRFRGMKRDVDGNVIVLPKKIALRLAHKLNRIIKRKGYAHA